MAETDSQTLYRRDAETLAKLGAVFARADLPAIEVRLSTHLADAAVEAWQREDEGELGDESFEQRVLRHRAGRSLSSV